MFCDIFGSLTLSCPYLFHYHFFWPASLMSPRFALEADIDLLLRHPKFIDTGGEEKG